MVATEKEIYGVIYKIANKVNNNVYIGQTKSNSGFNGRYCFSGNGIERVYKYHLKNEENNRAFNRHLLYSIKQYGFKNFEITEVFDVAFSKEELNVKEQHWIKEFDSFNSGYNNTLGGEGTNGVVGEKCYWYGKSLSEPHKRKLRECRIGKKLSLEVRIKIGLANKGLKLGNKHPFYGKRGNQSPNFGNHMPESAKQRISVANKGRIRSNEWCSEHSEKMKGTNNPMYGISPKQRMDEVTYTTWLASRKASNETKAKMSKVKKGKLLSGEHKRNMSKASTTKRKIINIDTMEIMDSIKIAAKKYNLQITGISGVCRNIKKTCGGYQWMYYDEYEKSTSAF